MKKFFFLRHWFEGNWIIENVVPYYEPLISPTRKIGRHLFWSNFMIPGFNSKDADIKEGNIKQWEEFHDVDISSYKGDQRKDKILRNIVHYETGRVIFNIARGSYQQNNKDNQTRLII